MPPHHNSAYSIRRDNILRALNLSARIPLGQTGEWADVEVVTGFWDDAWQLPRTTVILPRVILTARGVANRIQTACPECGTVMRFCGLQQHVGSRTCKKLAKKNQKGLASSY